jgi:rhamnulokinase
MRYLAFDLGASSGKLFAGVLLNDRLIVEPIHSFPNYICKFADGLYWDFFMIQSQMNLGIRKAAASGEITSFGIDSFNNDFSLLDDKGELLLPVRCYRDPRTEFYQKSIYQLIPREKLYTYTGNQLGPFNTFMQLAAMSLAGQSAVFEAAETLLLLPDLLGFSITGERVAEYTVAGETQFLDLQTRQWIPEILDAIQVPARILPQVCLPGTQCGRATKVYCDEQGVQPFNFVSVCEHDTASAFLGAPTGHEAAYISSGTWSLVGMETNSPIITDESFRYNIANEAGFPGHHRLLKNVMGFWILQELLREYAAENIHFDFVQTQMLAAGVKPFQFLCDPDSPEFFKPGDMRQKIRSACQKNGDSTPQVPGEFFRAVYEGLALRYRFSLELLERVSGRTFSKVNILGGGSRDAFACQCTANATGLPVIAGPADAAAIGNLLIQMIASGELSDASQAREVVMRSFPVSTYFPADTSEWGEQYARFLDIVSK